MRDKLQYALIHTIKNFSKKKANPIKLNNLIKDSNVINDHQTILRCQFMHNEIPIRMAQRIMELNELPYNFLKMNSMENVYNLYNNSFKILIDEKSPKNIKDADSYSTLLLKLKNEHDNINHDIATALSAYNKSCIMDNKDEQIINDILYRFYISRVSIRFLITQHLEVCKNKDFGIINKNCKPHAIIQNVIANIEQMSYIIYKKTPIIDLNYEYNDNELIYIDSHIDYIVSEILKNSVRAIMENDLEQNPIKIDIQTGKQDLIIKISDLGLGFDRKLVDKLFNFTYTTGNIENYIDKKTIISGYGHGLGLSRIYAQYFGGDLVIIPFEGVGTDVYIYLNRLGTCEENICDYIY